MVARAIAPLLVSLLLLALPVTAQQPESERPPGSNKPAPAAGAEPRAQPVPPDSSASPLLITDPAALYADEAIEQMGDTLRVARGLDAPSLIMLRSLLVPGWGQAKNRAWLKAIFFAGLGAAFYERLYYEYRMIDRYQEKARAAQGDQALVEFFEGKVERHRGHRRDFFWWTGLFLAICGGDAYVDAHLRGFDVRIQVAPGELDQDGSGTGAPEVRLSLALQRR